MSNINPQNIDGTFPIAGQDNNSQGFRNNFTNTINNFTFAAAELTDLQNNAVLKGPLSSVGQTSAPTNNMNYTLITAPQLLQTVETVYNGFGTISNGGTFQVDWTFGHYQQVTLAGSATMSFNTTWPTSGYYTELTLQANVQVAGSTLTLPAAVSDNAADIYGLTVTGGVPSITFQNTGLYTYRFSTSTAGAVVTIRDLVNNYQTNPYQFLSPSGNIAFSANIGVNRVIMAPTTVSPFGAIVTLPIGNVDAKTVTISSNVATTLQVLPSVGTTVSPSANIALTAGSASTFFYHATESKWYKIG